MATVQLKAVKREELGKERVAKLRQDGKLPAVLYGPDLPDPIPLSLDAIEAQKLILKEGREASYELKVGRKKYTAKIKEIQRDVLTEGFLHLDFYVPAASNKTKK